MYVGCENSPETIEVLSNRKQVARNEEMKSKAEEVKINCSVSV